MTPDTSTFRYACFMLHCTGLDETATWLELQEWNECNKSLLLEEAEHLINQGWQFIGVLPKGKVILKLISPKEISLED